MATDSSDVPREVDDPTSGAAEANPGTQNRPPIAPAVSPTLEQALRHFEDPTAALAETREVCRRLGIRMFVEIEIEFLRNCRRFCGKTTGVLPTTMVETFLRPSPIGGRPLSSAGEQRVEQRWKKH